MSELRTAEEAAAIRAAVLRQPPLLPPGFVSLTRHDDGSARRIRVEHIISYSHVSEDIARQFTDHARLRACSFLRDISDRGTDKGYTGTIVLESPETIDVLITLAIGRSHAGVVEHPDKVTWDGYVTDHAAWQRFLDASATPAVAP